MKKLSLLLLLAMACATTNAQTLTRYKDEVFSQYKVHQNVKYGANVPFASQDPQDLYMDVYEPAGDNVTDRPLLIIAHGGSFLPLANQPKSPLGTKYDYPIVEMAARFARQGYVVVSLDYRLGWNPAADDEETRKSGIIQAVWRATQDAKACVRFMRSKAAEYKIDANKIAFAGSQAGGYLPVNMLYFDKDAELQIPKLLKQNGDRIIDQTKLGDFEGTSGTPGVSSAINLGISLGAAVADLSFIEGGEKPLISMHGTNDAVTPYGTAIVIPAATGKPVVEVSGGRDMIAKATEKGNQTLLASGFDNSNLPGADVAYDDNGQKIAAAHPGLYSFFKADFQPYAWYDGDTPAQVTKAKAYCDTVVWFLTPRMFKVLDLPTLTYNEVVTQRAEAQLQTPLQVFPNPTAGNLNIVVGDAKVAIEKVTIVDLAGRVAIEAAGNGTNALSLNQTNLPQGIYTVKIQTNAGVAIQKLIAE